MTSKNTPISVSTDLAFGTVTFWAGVTALLNSALMWAFWIGVGGSAAYPVFLTLVQLITVGVLWKTSYGNLSTVGSILSQYEEEEYPDTIPTGRGAAGVVLDNAHDVGESLKHRREADELPNQAAESIQDVQEKLANNSPGSFDDTVQMSGIQTLDDFYRELNKYVRQSEERVQTLENRIELIRNQFDTLAVSEDNPADLSDLVGKIKDLQEEAEQAQSYIETANDISEETASTTAVMASDYHRTADKAAEVSDQSDEVRDQIDRLQEDTEQTEERIRNLKEAYDRFSATVEFAHSIANSISTDKLQVVVNDDHDEQEIVTEELELLVEETNEATNQLDKQIETVKSESDEAASLLTETMEEYQEILTDVEQITQQLTNLAEALDRIDVSVSEVDKATTRQTEKIDSAASDLSAIIEELDDVYQMCSDRNDQVVELQRTIETIDTDPDE